MRKFTVSTLIFFSVLFVILSIGIILPVTPRASKYMLFAKNDKDALLKNEVSPRIIFIGGSNLSFGLNSQMIKDSLGLNPINTAISASIGLMYMLDNTLVNIKSGDIVIIAPEYSHFYASNAYGGEELLRTILDVSPLEMMKLSRQQLVNIFSFIPKYSFSKFRPNEYIGFSESNIYSVSSFNKFGDAVGHWNLPKEKFAPFESLGDDYNPTIIENLLIFRKKIEEKGGNLFISYPGYQDISFDKSTAQIAKIESALKQNNFTILGNPQRYKIPDSLMFNTPYHLLKKGVDIRTNLLITDLKKNLNVSTKP